jgi:hypothetical protein
MSELTETLGRAGLTVCEALAGEDDLSGVTRALAREQVIRDLMRETGESREIVTETLDAAESMDQEAVLGLTEGAPTTLADALRRYVTELEERPGPVEELSVAADLTALLAYPWPDEEAVIATHADNRSVMLTVAEQNNGQMVSIQFGDNRWQVHQVFRDDSRSVLEIAEQVAIAVHRAMLGRIIGDRDHHVQFNQGERHGLLAFLDRPSGSWSSGRLTVDAVAGGGVVIRTRPYAWQSALAEEKRRLSRQD